MKKIYDIVTRHYTEDKDKKWAEIGIFLTFSVCIDKLCKRKYFVDNFLPYFEWSKNEKK